jgi:hypothetical protein
MPHDRIRKRRTLVPVLGYRDGVRPGRRWLLRLAGSHLARCDMPDQVCCRKIKRAGFVFETGS